MKFAKTKWKSSELTLISETMMWNLDANQHHQLRLQCAGSNLLQVAELVVVIGQISETPKVYCKWGNRLGLPGTVLTFPN